MPDEIWLYPHRDGMVKVDARISRIGPQESAIIELLASGGMKTPEQVAERLWPGKWPQDWLPLIQHRITLVRKILPRGFVKSVHGRGRNPLAHPTIGWQLTGKIHIQSSAAGAAPRQQT